MVGTRVMDAECACGLVCIWVASSLAPAVVLHCTFRRSRAIQWLNVAWTVSVAAWLLTGRANLALGCAAAQYVAAAVTAACLGRCRWRALVLYLLIVTLALGGALRVHLSVRARRQAATDHEVKRSPEPVTETLPASFCADWRTEAGAVMRVVRGSPLVPAVARCAAGHAVIRLNLAVDGGAAHLHWMRAPDPLRIGDSAGGPTLLGLTLAPGAGVGGGTVAADAAFTVHVSEPGDYALIMHSLASGRDALVSGSVSILCTQQVSGSEDRHPLGLFDATPAPDMLDWPDTFDI